jgi:hypothetical protein
MLQAFPCAGQPDGTSRDTELTSCVMVRSSGRGSHRRPANNDLVDLNSAEPQSHRDPSDQSPPAQLCCPSVSSTQLRTAAISRGCPGASRWLRCWRRADRGRPHTGSPRPARVGAATVAEDHKHLRGVVFPDHRGAHVSDGM